MSSAGDLPQENTRVLVVDDHHAVFRYGMRAMLANAKGFEVVGEAATGEEAVEKAAEMRPDILLKDSSDEGILHAIRAVASGEADFGPGVV